MKTMHTTKLIFFIFSIGFVYLCLAVVGISPNPNPYYVTRDDGVSQGPIRLRRGAKGAWEEDEQGYTILPAAYRTYYYAQQDGVSGALVATNLPMRTKVNGTLVGPSPNSLGIPPHQRPNPKAQEETCSKHFCFEEPKPHAHRDLRRTSAKSKGVLKNLMVPFKFHDHIARTVPSVSDLNELMNHPGDGMYTAYSTLAPTGSVREYYLKNSYGQLIVDSYVANWVTIDYNETYCSNGNIRICLTNALSKVSAQVNFTMFDVDGDQSIDAIGFLHSGYGAEFGGFDAYNTYYTDRIWTHMATIDPTWTSMEGVSVSDYLISPAVWSTTGSNIGKAGTIAHELGHILGLPDLYDTDGNGHGIGAWSLMSYAWGFDNSMNYMPPMDAWCKITLGWINPTVIEPSNNPFTLGPQCQSSLVYKITKNFKPDEYLLLENRQKVCLYDSQMGGSYSGGLAIWHIDMNQPSYNTRGYPGQRDWPANGDHYKIALLQADGLYELEKQLNYGNYGDLFHSGDTLGPSNSSSGPYPNTDSYGYGYYLVENTGMKIMNIVTNGNNITFRLSFDPGTAVPSSRPTSKKKPVKPVKPTKQANQNIAVKPFKPTKAPVAKPTKRPSRKPSSRPTKFFSKRPSKKPTRRPTKNPSTTKQTLGPSVESTWKLTIHPSTKPTDLPTLQPSPRSSSSKPSNIPILQLSNAPTQLPTNDIISIKPTKLSSGLPTAQPIS